MELPDLDKTQQTQPHNPGDSSIEETMPHQTEQPDLGETVQTPLDSQPGVPTDFDATVPMSVHEDNPSLDATLPHQLAEEQNLSGGELAQTAPVPAGERAAAAETFPAPDGKPAQAGIEQLPPPPVELPPGTARRNPSWRKWALFGILALILIAISSGFAGYRSGLNERKSAESTQAAVQAKEQYDLGLQEMQAGQYGRARQRFEYVIRIDPQYPGAAEKLSQVLLSMNTTATPTVAPTPTLTPTPDNRGIEELFTQAQQSLANNDWDTTINTLLTLRKKDPTYQPVQVDDMLFAALRNRGKDKILKTADLEGGIYDLTLAEKFGPLDTDTKSYRTWAELYLRGASFWKLDWAQSVYYFAQVAPAMPNLRDGSGMSATERYRQALAGYGDTFMKVEDWCNAQTQYETSLTVGGAADVEQKYNEAAQKCAEQQAPPEESNPEPTATPEGAIPTSAPATEAAPIVTTEAPPAPTTEAPPQTEAPAATTEAPPTDAAATPGP